MVGRRPRGLFRPFAVRLAVWEGPGVRTARHPRAAGFFKTHASARGLAPVVDRTPGGVLLFVRQTR